MFGGFGDAFKGIRDIAIAAILLGILVVLIFQYLKDLAEPIKAILDSIIKSINTNTDKVFTDGVPALPSEFDDNHKKAIIANIIKLIK